MILVFGGAYQGKYEWAKKNLKFDDDEVLNCTREMKSIDFRHKVYNHFEEFIYALTSQDKDAGKFLAENRSKIEDKIFIIEDISQGIVPIDPIDRAWREEVGRATTYIGLEAKEVYRVFCGLGQEIKND